MRQNKPRGVQFQAPLEDFPGIDHRLVNSPLAGKVDIKDMVPLVQVENRKRPVPPCINERPDMVGII